MTNQIMLPQNILRACTVGVLIEEGVPSREAMGILEADYNLLTAPEQVQRAIRKVASVFLTLERHGYLKELAPEQTLNGGKPN